VFRIHWTTLDGSGVPVAPSSAFTTADFDVVRLSDSVTKSTANGLTYTSKGTGVHELAVDPSIPTGDDDFWNPNTEYQVFFDTTKTVDGKSIDNRPVPGGKLIMPSVDVGLKRLDVSDLDDISYLLWDAGWGVCKDVYGKEPALPGDEVLSWWDRSGKYLAKLKGDNSPVATLREAPSRPGSGTMVVNNPSGQFFYQFDSSEIPIYTSSTHWGWSFSGSCSYDTVNARIPFICMQRSSGPTGTGQNSLGMRSNWNNLGFSGVDSSCRVFSYTGGVVCTKQNYPSAQPRGWQNCVFHKFDDGGTEGVKYFFNVPDRVEAPENTAGGGWATNANQIVIGGRDYDPADDSSNDDETDIDIGHAGLWVFDTAEKAERVAAKLQQHEKCYHGITFGDSRMTSLKCTGTFQAANIYGHQWSDASQAGDGVNDLQTKVNARDGRYYDWAWIWIGNNDFNGKTDYETPLQTLYTTIRDGLGRRTFEHVFLFNDVPKNAGTEAEQRALTKFSERLEQIFKHHPSVTLVDSWRSIQDLNVRYNRNTSYTSDGVHFGDNLNTIYSVPTTFPLAYSTRGYLILVHDLIVPIINQHFNLDRGRVDALMNNAHSLSTNFGGMASTTFTGNAIYYGLSGQRIYFYAYDPTVYPGSNVAVVGDATNMTAEISLDGGTPSNPTNPTNDVNPTEVGNGIYYFDVTVDETLADVIALSVSSSTPNVFVDPIIIATIPGGFKIAAELYESGTVDTVINGHTPTATEFQADDIVEATTSHYKDRVIYFTSGNLAGQAKAIVGYSLVGGIGQFITNPYTGAPANNDTFLIL
jgi:hypothetical protein